MEAIAIFLTGVAAGITWYKFFIVYVLERFTHTMCDYCEFQIKKGVISGEEKIGLLQQ